MRKRINPCPEVFEAWAALARYIEIHGRPLVQKGLYFPSGSDERADNLLMNAKYKKVESEAEIIFVEAVIKYHGENTIIERGVGTFSLWQVHLHQPLTMV